MTAPVRKLSEIGTEWPQAPMRQAEPPADLAGQGDYHEDYADQERPEPPLTLVPEIPEEPRAHRELVEALARLERFDREFAGSRGAVEHRNFSDEFVHAPPLDPQMMPPPPFDERPRHSRGFRLARTGLLAAGSALGVFYLVGVFPNLNEGGFNLASIGTQKTARLAVRPTIVVNDVRGTSGTWVPLGAAIQGSGEGATILVSGLSRATRLSAGQIDGAVWRVPAGELRTLQIQGPVNVSGAEDLLMEVQLADGSIADRRAFRFDYSLPKPGEARTDGSSMAAMAATPVLALEPPAQRQASLAPSAAIAPAEAVAPAAPAPEKAARHIDAEEIALLVKRGEDFLSHGDLAAARLVLTRAANAQDARAAFALGATYDPLVLQKLRVYGAAPDIELAVMWYERARQYGSREAPARLQALARKVP